MSRSLLVATLAVALLVTFTGPAGASSSGGSSPKGGQKSKAVLELAKSDGGATTVPGGTVVYDITFRNTGNAKAKDVRLTEWVPAHTVFVAAESSPGWSCADGALAGTECRFEIGYVHPSNELSTVQFAVKVADPVPDGVTHVHNKVKIDGKAKDKKDEIKLPPKATDDTPIITQPDLTVVKTDGDVEAVPGGVVTYTIVYGNDGPAANRTATGVVLTETVPEHTTFSAAGSDAAWDCNGVEPGNGDGAGAGATCTLPVGSLPAGTGGLTVTFAVVVSPSVPAEVDSLSNTVTISDDIDPGEVDASSTEATPVVVPDPVDPPDPIDPVEPTDPGPTNPEPTDPAPQGQATGTGRTDQVLPTTITRGAAAATLPRTGTGTLILLGLGLIATASGAAALAGASAMERRQSAGAAPGT